MTDDELLEVLLRVIRDVGGASGGLEVRGDTVPGPGLVRGWIVARGGSSFLLSADGGMLQYTEPGVSDDRALELFRAGRRSQVPDGALERAGFRR
ncbi:hypothetical protein GCM10017714_10960 [Curtobacterium pusillum]|nr:hypothetical protein GCM10017610_06410 [Curtobacterium pusillum]